VIFVMDATRIDAQVDDRVKTKSHDRKVDERATYVEEGTWDVIHQYSSRKGTRLHCLLRDQSPDVPPTRNRPE